MNESLYSYLLCLSAALLCYTGFQKYSFIRSTSCSCSTCCFGLGFQLQNLQDFIKVSGALIKDIFPVAETVPCDLWNRPFGEVQQTKLNNKFIMSTPSVRTWPIRTVQVQMGSMTHPMSEPITDLNISVSNLGPKEIQIAEGRKKIQSLPPSP